MRSNSDSFALPPVVADAHRRMPRHLRKSRDRKNNYIAEKPVSHGTKKAKSKRAGAPLLNNNAATHGGYCLEWRILRRYVYALGLKARYLMAERELARIERELGR